MSHRTIIQIVFSASLIFAFLGCSTSSRHSDLVPKKEETILPKAEKIIPPLPEETRLPEVEEAVSPKMEALDDFIKVVSPSSESSSLDSTSKFLKLIWFSNAVIFSLLFLLSIGIITFSVRRQISDLKRKRILLKFKNKFGNLGKDRSSLKSVLPSLATKISTEEFSNLIEERGVTNAKEIEQQFRDYLFSSGRIREIEQNARTSHNKWRRIEAIAFIHYINVTAALDILSKTLHDPDLDIAYFSMLALGRIKNRDSARILLQFLDKDVFSGQKIVSLLEDFPPAIVDEIVEVTSSPNPTVRFWAIKLLTKFKPQREFQKIAAFAEDSSPNVRSAACECLGEIEKKEAKNVLLKRLNDKVWFVRMQAVRALFKILGPESIPDLVELMVKDESTFVKESVKDAIVSDIEQALPYLRDCLNSQNLEARKYCIDALVDSNYVSQLLANVISSDSDVRNKALKLLESVIRSGVYFGLKKTLDVFVPTSKMKILSVIASMDKGLALRIQAGDKIKNAG